MVRSTLFKGVSIVSKAKVPTVSSLLFISIENLFNENAKVLLIFGLANIL